MATSSKKMASPLTEIPGHLLAEIFLRLPAPEDLARASAACDSPPTAPSSADSAASTHHHSSDSSTTAGHPRRPRPPRPHEQPPVFRDLAVCDPLHRRYVLLPQVPHDLAASLDHPFPMVSEASCKAFLVPLDDEEAAAGETAFRVILMANCKTSLAAFLFSSSTGQWQAAASKGWSDLGLGERDMAVMSWVHPFILRRHYAYGCFYWDWVEFGRKKLLLLDIRKMEFSIADLPPGEWNKEGGIAIVEAGECRLGIFGFHGKTSSSLSYTVARNKGESLTQWQMEMTISLDSGYRYFIRNATQRYLLFTRIKASSSLKDRLTGYFSMDVKTSQIQRVYEKQHYRLHEMCPYINFPPSLLSSRRI